CIINLSGRSEQCGRRRGTMGEGARKERAMATTLEELEKRVVALEHEVAALREKKEPARPARFGDNIPLFREARAQQAAISAAVAKAWAEMGITAEPVGPERLLEM